MKLFLMVLLFVWIDESFGQSNFIKGYIIQLNGDTLHGFIDYRNWRNNPNKITFKKKLDGGINSYLPTDIKEFSVSDQIYESAVVQVAIREYQPLKLRTDTTFLQAIIRGSKGLYFYSDKDRYEQFYIKTNSEFELLIYLKYVKGSDGKEVTVENNKYLNQLSYYLKDCQVIQSRLRNMAYRKSYLENIFTYYYKVCDKTEIEFQKKKEKIKIEFGVLSGIALMTPKFKGLNFPHFANGNFTNSTNISAGLYMNFIMRWGLNKWLIRYELVNSSYQSYGLWVNNIGPFQSDKYDMSFNYSYLKHNIMLRYKFPVNKIMFFVNGGISIGGTLNHQISLKQISTFYSTTRITNIEGISNVPETGTILSIGNQMKRFTLEMRYESLSGPSTSIGLSSPFKRYSFLIGYRF